MIQVCLNQAWHRSRGYRVEYNAVAGGERLIWLMDLDFLARSFLRSDWERLITLSENRGVASLVLAALCAARAKLATPLPLEVKQRLGQSRQPTAIENYLDHPDLALEFRSDLRATRSVDAKLNLILANVLPPRRHLVQKYPSWSGWPTVLLTLRHAWDAALRLKRTKSST